MRRDLSQRLNLSPEEGEKWIVSLIRETRSDAKIDFVKVLLYPWCNFSDKKGIVIMNHPQQSVYQQVIERTKVCFYGDIRLMTGIIFGFDRNGPIN
jgi:translation initiation factor 3 subunit E